MGRLLPSPQQRADDPTARCTEIEVNVYGRVATLKVQVFDAIWRKSGEGGLLRFVLIRDWPGHKKDDVLISTDVHHSARFIIAQYCRRWPIEETFHWCKAKLGLQDPQNRTERAVRRTAPMALWAYSIIVVWYITAGMHGRFASLAPRPWYISRKNPAFSDMLATLRRASWTVRLQNATRFEDRPVDTPSIQNSMAAILEAVGYG